ICRLAGAVEEFDANAARVDWALLNAAGPPAGASEAEVAEFTRLQGDSAKFLGRAESALGTFNQRVGEAGDLQPAELAAITTQVDSAGLHASLKGAIEAQDWPTAETLVGETQP